MHSPCLCLLHSFFLFLNRRSCLILLTIWISDTELLHGVITFNCCLCQYLFISSAFFLLREAFNSRSEEAVSISFILSFFFLSLSVFFKATYFAVFCFLTISSFLNFQPDSLLLLLDIVSIFFGIFVSNSFRFFVSQ